MNLEDALSLHDAAAADLSDFFSWEKRSGNYYTKVFHEDDDDRQRG
jgi:hypothetical protein